MRKLDDYLQIGEAAEYLGVCQNTLRNWGAAGKVVDYRHPVNNYGLHKTKDFDRLITKVEKQQTKKRKPKWLP